MVFQQKNVVEKPVITYRLISTLVPTFLWLACAASLNHKIVDTSLSATISHHFMDHNQGARPSCM